LTFEVTLGNQAFIGVEHWRAGYFQIFRQVPAGRYLLSGLQIATQNCGTEPFADLVVQWKPIKAVDREDGRNS
jgi:hypothetical protein